MLLFYKFVASFPHLPDSEKLHELFKQFSSHFARMCEQRPHHCTNLRDLNFDEFWEVSVFFEFLVLLAHSAPCMFPMSSTCVRPFFSSR